MSELKADGEPRRDFLKKASCVVIGGVITAVPLIAGVRVIMDPLRHKAAGGQKVKVTTIDSLPKDGEPRKFAILASRSDAWNRFPDAPIGAIYLRRTGENSVEAMNVVCPHAGCFVDFRPEKKAFFCPCHNSLFAIDGKIADPRSPAPRGLDTLKTEIKGNEIWVEFQNFRTGMAEKTPLT
jgi:quinol---cytochrome c reductase iron-sulfur subunit, bacillus type